MIIPQYPSLCHDYADDRSTTIRSSIQLIALLIEHDKLQLQLKRAYHDSSPDSMILRAGDQAAERYHPTDSDLPGLQF